MSNHKMHQNINLLIVGALAFLLSYILTKTSLSVFHSNHYWLASVFFVGTNLLINIFLFKGDKQSKEFVFKTLALGVVRLLLCMVFILIYNITHKSQSLPFAIHFMIQYLIFTVFEVSYLLRFIKSSTP